MYIRRLLYSTPGQYIISVLLGLGLATLFRKACTDRSCIVFKDPSLNEIKGKTFKYGDKCYKFRERAHPCTPDRKTVDFA